MRGWGLWAALFGVAVGGCAPALVGPRALKERTDPAPYLASLAAYNAAPRSARIGGRLRASGKGSAEFGGTVVAGSGLRVDGVAGPFGTAVFALACRAEEGCRAYVPSRRTLYLLREASWRELLESLLLGRVPLLGESAGAWVSADGTPVLFFRGGDGWEERVELAGGTLLPDRVFLGRQDEDPLIRVSYGEYGEAVEGQPFPRRIEVSVRKPPQEYEILVRRVEPAANVDESTFGLSPPPGTREESVEGRATWNETGISLWPPSGTPP